MDPAFPFAHFALAEAYDRDGSYQEALEEHDKTIELARAGQAFDLAGGDAPRAWYALTGRLQNTYRALGGANYWQRQLESVHRSYEKGTTTATAVAEIQAILGDNEHVLAWLRKAYEESDDFLVFTRGRVRSPEGGCPATRFQSYAALAGVGPAGGSRYAFSGFSG